MVHDGTGYHKIGTQSQITLQFRELYAAKKSFLDVCTYGKTIRFMTFFDVTEILQNITYSKSRFDFPNTLVERREPQTLTAPWTMIICKHVTFYPRANLVPRAMPVHGLAWHWLWGN